MHDVKALRVSNNFSLAFDVLKMLINIAVIRLAALKLLKFGYQTTPQNYNVRSSSRERAVDPADVAVFDAQGHLVGKAGVMELVGVEAPPPLLDPEVSTANTQ